MQDGGVGEVFEVVGQSGVDHAIVAMGGGQRGGSYA